MMLNLKEDSSLIQFKILNKCGHKLDTNNWREFRVGDLFEIVLAKGDMQPKLLEDGEVPLVSAGNENNGIIKFVDIKGDGISRIFKANCITVNMFGKAFYQNIPFYAVSHGRINILKPKFELNELIGTFISSVLTHSLFGKYNYSTMCNRSKLKNEYITLPSTSNGEPDYEYMENYMKYIIQEIDKVATHINNLKNNNYYEHKINISNWKEFRLVDLFPLIHSKKYNEKDVFFTDEGETINYVTRGKFNNGIKGKVKKEDKFIINPKGTISFGAENADFFYQNKPYITGDKMYYIDTRNISKYACLFLKTILQKELSYKFSYMEGMTPNKIINEYITLPSNSNGEPDYEYMEKYMENVMKEEEIYAEQINAIYEGAK